MELGRALGALAPRLEFMWVKASPAGILRCGRVRESFAIQPISRPTRGGRQDDGDPGAALTLLTSKRNNNDNNKQQQKSVKLALHFR